MKHFPTRIGWCGILLSECLEAEIFTDSFIQFMCTRNNLNVILKIFRHFTNLWKLSYANDG